MAFSKRPRPMSFGGPGEDAAETPAPVGQEAEALGFQPLRPARADRPVMLHGARRGPIQAERYDTEATPALTRFEEPDAPPSGWPIWLMALLIAGLWALAPIAFAVGYRSKVAPLQSDPFALTVFALLAIGPAIFVLGAAYMIRQGQKLGFETRRAKAMAEDMLSPALVAAARAGDVAMAVREEIRRAGAAADEARETLAAMRDALAFETDKLTGATAQSVRTAQELAATLGRERSEMGALALTLDAQATRVADTITQQARMVSDAADVAQSQIREAEAALSARAADLAAAAGEAGAAARAAGEDLTRHIARLETAGTGVAEQVKAVEGGLSSQRTALVELSQALRADQTIFASEAEVHAARLATLIAEVRQSQAQISESAESGGEALRQLMAEAAVQFRDIAAAAGVEREAFGQSTLQALEVVSAAAADQRAQLEAQTRAAIEALARAAEETRLAAARHAEAARAQVDQLSEAAFTAGQKANQVFENRLEEARSLVEHSSRLVEEAGEATARKLELGAAAARATLDELSALLTEVETRAERLPVAARGQAEQIRTVVAEGLEELMAQARRTSDEAQAIDAAFQVRVRRNFEMLSEAVKLMGMAAAAPAPAPVSMAPAPRTRARAADPATPEPVTQGPPAVASDDPTGAPLADRIGLRNRIRLTPTATDKEFSAVFEAAGGVAVPATDEGDEADEGEAWTWKDLLASLDGADGEGERLEVTLSAELASMGVDVARLLPQGRIEEIAAAIQTGDAEGGREVVRKLAPAATRRIARRLLTDEEIRRRCEVYVRRYKTLIDEAIGRDPEGFALESLLGADGGRTFLLLDAAAGDTI